MENFEQNPNEENLFNRKDLVILVFFSKCSANSYLMKKPILNIARENQNKIKLYITDIDRSADLTTSFGIREVPTILLFKNGWIVDRIDGAVGKKELSNKINKFL